MRINVRQGKLFVRPNRLEIRKAQDVCAVLDMMSQYHPLIKEYKEAADALHRAIEILGMATTEDEEESG